MIILGEDEASAERTLQAIREMLAAIGRVQAEHAGMMGQAGAESASLEKRWERGTWLLVANVAAARHGRGGAGLSWPMERLIELIEADAEVSASTARTTSSYVPSTGATRPYPEPYLIPDRGYYRLPGPFRHVTTTAATVHPLTGEQRTRLNIGRTLIHELVIHAWRDVFFYQAPPGSREYLANPDARQQSVHRDVPHSGADAGDHNLADYEADLIDHYYDLAIGLVPSRQHPEYHRARRGLGGLMGRGILTWQHTTQRQRLDAAEWRRERARFVQQAEQFIRTRQALARRDRRGRH